MTADAEAQIVGAARFVLGVVGTGVATVVAALSLWVFTEIVEVGRNQARLLEQMEAIEVRIGRMERAISGGSPPSR